MAHRAGQFRLPPPDHACNGGLGEIDVLFVIPARLDIEHRRLGPIVIPQRIGKVTGGVVNVDVLA